MRIDYVKTEIQRALELEVASEYKLREIYHHLPHKDFGTTFNSWIDAVTEGPFFAILESRMLENVSDLGGSFEKLNRSMAQALSNCYAVTAIHEEYLDFLKLLRLVRRRNMVELNQSLRLMEIVMFDFRKRSEMKVNLPSLARAKRKKMPRSGLTRSFTIIKIGLV